MASTVKPVAERAIRLAPQAQVDTRAIELVSSMRGDLDGHKDVDAIQFATVKAELATIKVDIKALNDDAKKGLDEVRRQQDDNHKENSAKLAELINKQAGERGAVGFILNNLPTVLSTASIVLLILWHK